MNEYHVYACDCGRIHAIPYKKLDNGRELGVICRGCCRVRVLYIYEGKVSTNFPGLDDVSITEDKFCYSLSSELSEIYFSPGIKVPMKTGGYATSYSYTFGLTDTNCLDLSLLRSPWVAEEEKAKYISDWEEQRKTIDVQRLIQENSSDVLKAIASAKIKGVDLVLPEVENAMNEDVTPIHTSEDFTFEDFCNTPEILMPLLQKGINHVVWFKENFPNGASSKEEVINKIKEEDYSG